MFLIDYGNLLTVHVIKWMSIAVYIGSHQAGDGLFVMTSGFG